jgi:hypothetical protein
MIGKDVVSNSNILGKKDSLLVLGIPLNEDCRVRQRKDDNSKQNTTGSILAGLC